MKTVKKVNPNDSRDLARIEKALREQYEWGKRDVNVYILSHDEKRTLSQNRYYWTLMQILSDELGEHRTYYHKFFKAMFMPREEITVKGFTQIAEGSTTDFTTGEMTEYVENIILFAETRLGIIMPRPGEVPIEVYLKAQNNK